MLEIIKQLEERIKMLEVFEEKQQDLNKKITSLFESFLVTIEKIK